MRDAFFAHRTLPTFTYTLASAFDTQGYLRALTAVADRVETFPVAEIVRSLYREKIEELRTRCMLVQAMQRGDDATVTSLTDHLFGMPEQTARDIQAEFEGILSRSSTLHTHKARINAVTLTAMIRTILDHYGMTEWTVRETTRPSIAITRSAQRSTPTIKIPKTFSASRARAARVLTHEIEVHALRSHNGATSPLQLLGRGLANYISTDEGLAITLQRIGATKTTEPGLWEAWTAALTLNHGFIDTFDTLVSARTKLNIALGHADASAKAQDSAWRLMVRASRGIHAPGTPGLGYRRDHIYRTGRIAIERTLEAHGVTDILPTLFAGHVGIHHIPALKTLGITGRTPDMISAHVVQEVLRAQRKTRA